MKVISFFSRFAVICNIAFLLFIFFSKLEIQKPVTQGRDTVIAVPFLKDLVITLGISAIIINLVMCIVYAVIEGAERKGLIKQGNTIVEYTAGTTGISLAFVCASLGYSFHAVFSDAFSNEKRITMKAFGATVTDVLSDN